MDSYTSLNRGSCQWLPNKEQMSYSACQMGPMYSIGISDDISIHDMRECIVEA
jgi:hypothetical protein